MLTAIRQNYHAAYIMDALTNRCIASAYFTRLTARWSWVQEVVAGEYECEPDEVGCIETENGDKITVRNVPVAYLTH